MNEKRKSTKLTQQSFILQKLFKSFRQQHFVKIVRVQILNSASNHKKEIKRREQYKIKPILCF